jgi:Flp pilus assembly protein TadD
MCGRLVGVFLSMAAALVLLTGCESWTKTAASFKSTHGAADQAGAGPDSTGSIAAGPQAPPAPSRAEPVDPDDDLNLGKKQYREGNYGLAEQHFRRAAEKAPGEAHADAEAWLGLAASYDRLRRFELADRAYAHALKILGPTPELLNNQGYSYLIRGDYRRARVKLAAAHDLDPDSPYIQSNLDLLEKSVRDGRH